MFTPGTKKSQFPRRKGRNEGRPAFESPSTPVVESLGPPRPATGTPAPWGSRLSFLARYAVDHLLDFIPFVFL